MYHFFKCWGLCAIITAGSMHIACTWDSVVEDDCVYLFTPTRVCITIGYDNMHRSVVVFLEILVMMVQTGVQGKWLLLLPDCVFLCMGNLCGRLLLCGCTHLH